MARGRFGGTGARGGPARGKGPRDRGRGRGGQHPGGIHPGLRPVTEDMRMAIKQQLDEFRANDEAELTFPAGLTNHDRAVVHDMCRRYGFDTKSYGCAAVDARGCRGWLALAKAYSHRRFAYAGQSNGLMFGAIAVHGNKRNYNDQCFLASQ
ncbi:unnamed protein product [Ostreobium quekettii]|uniref:R3H domain-containing protein n=1 Tax=Ostreobium quekettii TaxID=121088 RepID=A0A8S1J7C9_9CHLO|nr:unnamed protein product [Ostreobium quekettii]|eukprot:evm.model.scf_1675.2 EVM.evm.TU.scf_1675.2   scf_1675:18148-20130(+)